MMINATVWKLLMKSLLWWKYNNICLQKMPFQKSKNSTVLHSFPILSPKRQKQNIIWIVSKMVKCNVIVSSHTACTVL